MSRNNFTSLKPGDIVSMNVGNNNDDHEWYVIVISKNLFHASSNSFVGLTIIHETGQIPYTLQINPNNLESTTLSRTSRVRYDRIISMKQRSVLEKKGNVTSQFLSEIMAKIKTEILEI